MVLQNSINTFVNKQIQIRYRLHEVTVKHLYIRLFICMQREYSGIINNYAYFCANFSVCHKLVRLNKFVREWSIPAYVVSSVCCRPTTICTGCSRWSTFTVWSMVAYGVVLFCWSRPQDWPTFSGRSICA